MHGKGSYKHNGGKYIGNWVDGKKHGEFQDVSVRELEFEHGELKAKRTMKRQSPYDEETDEEEARPITTRSKRVPRKRGRLQEE
eukprot:scaffold13860_cov68-Skeletonema_marinoi.AAC.2